MLKKKLKGWKEKMGLKDWEEDGHRKWRNLKYYILSKLSFACKQELSTLERIDPQMKKQDYKLN